MNKQIVTDLILIVIVFALFLGCVVVSVASHLPTDSLNVGTVDVQKFYADFENWALVVVAVSAVAALGWYVLGEWGPRPESTSHGTWLLIWFLLLALTIGGGSLALYSVHPDVQENEYVVAAYFLGGGFLFYYLATMLFSPVNVKFTVPGSKIFRRW